MQPFPAVQFSDQPVRMPLSVVQIKVILESKDIDLQE